MPGVRINHLLASTAVVLLLAGAPAVTLAGPSDTATNATAAAPDTTNAATPAPADADKAATPQPLDSANLPATTGSTPPATAETTPAAAAAPPRLRNPRRRPARLPRPLLRRHPP